MKLHYYYDSEADILYLSQGKPSRNDITKEAPDDTILRFDKTTKKIKGFTVLNFTKRMKGKNAAIALPLKAELTLA